MLQEINLGQAINDGTGDDLRTAFLKVIANFQYLESEITEPVDAVNVGLTDQGIFKEKIDNILYFKSIVAGDNIEIQSTENTIIVSTTQGLDLKDNNIENIGDLYVKGRIELDPATNSELVGPTTGLHTGLVNGTVYAPLGTFGLQGDVIGRNPGNRFSPDYQPARIDGIAVKDLNTTVNSFDFGTLNNNIINPLQYLLSQVGIDFGTVMQPSPISINFGRS